MKFAAFFVLLFAVTVYAVTEEEDWTEFKKKYEKTYEPEEDAKRFEIYKKKVAEVNEHNIKHEKGEISYSAGINQFADLTEEEWAMRFHGLVG